MITFWKKILMSDPSTPKSRKLLDQIRDAIRLKQYSCSTEKTCVHWARRYVLFNKKRHPVEMGGAEIEAILTHLAGKATTSPLPRRTRLSMPFIPLPPRIEN
jgi:hypothetical protein